MQAGKKVAENFMQKGPGQERKNEPLRYVRTDVLIAGAGAAGLFAALLLARRGLKVTILESGPRPGRKLAISGGGHANFTNLRMSPQKFLAPPDNDFCVPALREWTVRNMIDFVQSLGFSYVEKAQGRLFLRAEAIELVKRLCQEYQGNGGEIIYGEAVKSLEKDKGRFKASTDKLIIQASKAILALGSPARPRLASCLDCWRLAGELGHKVYPPKAALTPLNYTGARQEKLRSLAGISAAVHLTLKGPSLLKAEKSWEDDLLFTHTGLSGPAILCASLYYTAGSLLEINFLPGQDFESILDEGEKGSPRSLLRALLPDRLADMLLPSHLATRKVAELSRKDRQTLAQGVNAWQISQLKPAGLDSAEICSGGVDLIQIDPHSMESRIVPGLHICGEMQNVSGELGGYNLHWAFASAFLAARAIWKNAASGMERTF